MANDALRSLPSVERLLARPLGLRLAEQLGRSQVRDLLRHILDEMRREIESGVWSLESGVSRAADFATNDPPASGIQPPTPGSRLQTPDFLIEEIERRLEVRGATAARPSLRRVVNATGVIIHTNLGRAPLAEEAIAALIETAAGYSNLEYDLERGERGRRESHCRELLARLAGSEAALVTNNNAAAVMLVLNTLAEGGEVIV